MWNKLRDARDRAIEHDILAERFENEWRDLQADAQGLIGVPPLKRQHGDQSRYWRPWFAWYPVPVEEGGWRWLTWLDRKSGYDLRTNSRWFAHCEYGHGDEIDRRIEIERRMRQP